MNLLAFDTSTSTCVVGLMKGDQSHLVHCAASMKQAQQILPIVDELLTSQNMALADLQAIAYGQGPGSLTGIRIASGVAQGLQIAHRIPLVPISSLAAIAKTAMISHSATQVVIAKDAKMGRIYWAIYQKDADGLQLVGDEQLCSPSEVSFSNLDDWCAVGEGWTIYENQLQVRLGLTPPKIVSIAAPSAEALLKLAVSQFERGDIVIPADANPIYLR